MTKFTIIDGDGEVRATDVTDEDTMQSLYQTVMNSDKRWYFYDGRRPFDLDTETDDELIQRCRYLRAAYWLFEGGDV